MLSRYSRESDVVFGSTMSGRSAPVPGIERMVGLFLKNTLPIRVRMQPNQLVTEWLSHFQDEQLEIRDHEASALVEVLGWSEVPLGDPLFETLFVFENYRSRRAPRRTAEWSVVAKCVRRSRSQPTTR